MHDYTSYFCGNKDANELCQKHKAFEWINDNPYCEDSDSPYTVESYSIKFVEPDSQSVIKLEDVIIKQIHTVMEVINGVHHFGVNTEWNLKHDKIGEKSAQGWLPMVLGLREDLLKEYDETMKEHK